VESNNTNNVMSNAMSFEDAIAIQKQEGFTFTKKELKILAKIFDSNTSDEEAEKMVAEAVAQLLIK
jgi:hypothetical protein